MKYNLNMKPQSNLQSIWHNSETAEMLSNLLDIIFVQINASIIARGSSCSCLAHIIILYLVTN